MKSPPSAAALRELAGQPAAAALATTILAGTPPKDLLLAALKVLAEQPTPTARPSLQTHYERFSRNKGKQDQGGYLRRAILETARAIGHPEDAEWFAQGCATYEFWPPDFADDAVAVRAAALVALAEVDDRQARLHAARLLVDPHTARMSGEPALSAARVLGALDELLPLYTLVCQNNPATQPDTTLPPEVLGECLRQLHRLPGTAVGPLADGYATAPSAVVRMGLFDLLLHHPEGLYPRALQLLEESQDLDLYRYMVVAIVLAGSPQPLEALRQHARREHRRQRLAILQENGIHWGTESRQSDPG